MLIAVRVLAVALSVLAVSLFSAPTVAAQLLGVEPGSAEEGGTLLFHWYTDGAVKSSGQASYIVSTTCGRNTGGPSLTGSASSSDFVGSTGVVTWNGSDNKGSVSVDLTEDQHPEPDETFYFEWTSWPGTGPSTVYLASFCAVGTIRDNDTRFDSPTNFSVDAVRHTPPAGYAAVDLSWWWFNNMSSTPSGFTIAYYDSDIDPSGCSGSWDQSFFVPGAASRSASISGLNRDRWYCFRVRAEAPSGSTDHGSWSAAVRVDLSRDTINSLRAPVAPTVTRPAGDNGVLLAVSGATDPPAPDGNLSWQYVQREAGQDFGDSPPPTGFLPGLCNQTTGGGGRAPVTANIIAGRTYVFKVRYAHATCDIWRTSPDVAVSPWSPASAPLVYTGLVSAPANLRVSGGNRSCDLVWDAPSAVARPDSYDVQYALGTSESAPWLDSLPAPSGSVTSHTISGLTQDSQYRVRVRAVLGDAKSDWTQANCRTTGPGSNSPPQTVGSISDVALKLNGTGLSFSAAPYFRDPDGDELSYTVVSSDTRVVTVSPASGTGSLKFTVVPVSGATGDATVTITASDPSGESATQSFDVSVTRDPPPGPPTSVALVANDTTVVLSWSEPENFRDFQSVVYETQVRVDRGHWTPWVPSTSGTSASMSGVRGSTYEGRVLAKSGAAKSAWVTAGPVTVPDAPTPGPPTAVGLVANDRALVLSWSEPANFRDFDSVAYDVEVRVNGASWTPWPGYSSGTSASMSGVRGSTYEGRVLAKSGAAKSAWVTAGPVTVPDAPTPGPPTAVGLVANDRALVLSWSEPANFRDFDSVAYDVEVRVNGASWTPWPGYSSGTSASMSGVRGSTYEGRVLAKSGAAKSAWVTAGPVTVPDAPTPGPPTAVGLVANDRALVLSWSEPANFRDFDSVAYDVEVRVNGASWTPWPGYSSGTSASMSGVRGSTYEGRVLAKSGAARSAWVTAGPVTVPDAPTPGPPTAVGLVANDRALVLSWSEPANFRDFDSVAYEVEVRVDGASWKAWGGYSSGTSASMSGVRGSTYEGRVLAKSGAARSAWVTAGPVTVPDAPTPGPPTNVSFAADNLVLTLSWDEPANHRDFTGVIYDVEYRRDGGSWTQWVTSTSATSARRTGERGSVYHARVLAKVGTAKSAWVSAGPVTARGVNRRPTVIALVEARVLAVENGAEEIGLSTMFADPDGDELMFSARSSAAGVVTATINPGPPPVLVLAPGKPGDAVVTVTATDPGGLWVSLSFAVTVTMTDISAPRNLRLIPSGRTAVNAQWDPPAQGAGKVDRYRLEHRGDSTSWQPHRVEGATSYLITDLQYGCRYHVRVRGEDESTIIVGDPPTPQTLFVPGEWSAEKSVVLGTAGRCLAVPPVPSGVVARVAARRVMVVTWTVAPADFLVESYELRHRPLGGEWTTVTLEAGSVPPWRSAALEPGDYEVQLRARNAHGWSAWSPPVEATAVPDPVISVGLSSAGRVFDPGEALSFRLEPWPPSLFELEVNLTVGDDFVLARPGGPAAGELRVLVPPGSSRAVVELRERVPYFDLGTLVSAEIDVSSVGPPESGVLLNEADWPLTVFRSNELPRSTVEFAHDGNGMSFAALRQWETVALVLDRPLPPGRGSRVKISFLPFPEVPLRLSWIGIRGPSPQGWLAIPAGSRRVEFEVRLGHEADLPPGDYVPAKAARLFIDEAEGPLLAIGPVGQVDVSPDGGRPVPSIGTWGVIVLGLLLGYIGFRWVRAAGGHVGGRP